ncbi:MAG: Glucokinase [Labilithrix sp.]|nr:Glucokinase [Labilithrix sp.]
MVHVLAGDIGGTRARFAVFDVTKAPRLVHQDVLESRSFKTFEAALKAFLGSVGKVRITAASFGIAGPVVDQRVKTTNLPWVIDARTIARTFAIPTVTLLNDLVAAGLGAISSPPSKLAVIHKGRPKTNGGNLAVIAAGTGLGQAAFVWDGTEHMACPTEGGHVDFAPRNGIEDELLALLRTEYGHVSYERIASGSTIAKVHEFFVREQRVKESKEASAYLARAEDPNVAVVELAETGRSEAAMRAIELWSSVYGAEAGNLALKCLATAGVYVCGGVSARLAPVLANGLPSRKKKSGPSPFVEAFLDKGRMRPLLEAIPVAVCLEQRAGLLGAVTHAAGLATAAPPKAKSRAKR